MSREEKDAYFVSVTVEGETETEEEEEGEVREEWLTQKRKGKET